MSTINFVHIVLLRPIAIDSIHHEYFLYIGRIQHSDENFFISDLLALLLQVYVNS